MKKEVLSSISGVEIYPIISFVLLGSIFIGVLIYTFSLKKGKVEQLSDLPFDSENSED